MNFFEKWNVKVAALVKAGKSEDEAIRLLEKSEPDLYNQMLCEAKKGQPMPCFVDVQNTNLTNKLGELSEFTRIRKFF